MVVGKGCVGMSDKKKVIKERTKDVKIGSVKVLKSHELLTDNLKRRKIKIYLYKGTPIASRELIETDVSNKKLRLVRIRVDFMKLYDKVSIDMLVVKDNIETIDIDLRYLELFFKRYFDRWLLVKLFAPIVEKHDALPPGSLIGELVLEYGQFVEFVKFLEFMLREPLTHDKCI